MSPLKRLSRLERDAHRREAATAVLARRAALERADEAIESAIQADRRAIAALMRCDRHARPGDFDDMDVDEILAVLGHGVDEPYHPAYVDGRVYVTSVS